MATFEEAIPHILKHEGGFVNHPADPGGATNWGISLRFLKGRGMIGDYDGDGDVDIDDIRIMTEENAKTLYRVHFWEPNGYERIEVQDIANKVFDLSVNMGPVRAVKILQESLRDCRRDLKVDGVFGPKTLASTNGANPSMLLGAMRANQRHYYESLIRQNGKLAAFRKGWLRRAVAI